jgi:hypothetical protein
MQSILDSADAWFFDSAAHKLDGALILRLVEGVKGPARQFVDVGGARLGPYFPVQVGPLSRCVEVTFKNALAFFAYNESYDTADPELKKGTGRFLFVAESSSFRRFAESRTSLAQQHAVSYEEFVLCCEDRIFHVLSSDVPEVAALHDAPNLTVQRTTTWSAS